MGNLEKVQLPLNRVCDIFLGLFEHSLEVRNSSMEDGDVAVQTEKPKLKRPPLYKVVMLNDDYTPMEFVIEILERFFSMNREKATQVMLTVHTQGKATCGIFSRDIAETKAAQVNQYAREHEHPLLCEIEASDGDDAEL